MKLSKTKAVRMLGEQGRSARADLIEATERAQYFEASLHHLCSLLGVEEPNVTRAVAQAANRIREMQVAGAECADLRAQLAKVRHDRNEAIGVIDDIEGGAA